MKKRALHQTLLVCFLFLFLFTLTSAKKTCSRGSGRVLKLASVHLIDRNGLNEMISGKDRLNQFQETNFLTSQPYQKVLRIYERDSRGTIRSVITTYHENGNPKQLLEVVNGRAHGKYFEWHENGNMAIATFVIGGVPDVTLAAQKSWLYDGESLVWNENQILIADINYSAGALEGESYYYHDTGELWKKIYYQKNKIEGLLETFRKDSSLLMQASFCSGERNGPCIRYWKEGGVASEEFFKNGKIETGSYLDPCGELVGEIIDGYGWRAVFGKEKVVELQQYENGEISGEVKVFFPSGRLKRFYHVSNGIKDGEEIEYFEEADDSKPSQPKLMFNWCEGKIEGMVRTWYRSGIQESQREMANNKKNGVLTAWYKDGNLMLIEEYEEDKLQRGDYFKRGERFPISQVSQGKGTATIYNAEGHFVRKITYMNGKPEV